MIPVLYDNENIDKTYGKGKLSEIISCVVYEELDGDYSVEFKYPVSGAHYNELINGGTIFCYTGRASYGSTVTDFQRAKEPCWFDIYKHSIPVDGVVTFYANHISRRLARKVFYMTSAVTAESGPGIITGARPTGQSYGNVHFGALENVSGVSGSFVMEKPQTALSLLVGGENSVTSYFGIDMSIYGRFTTVNNVPDTPEVLFVFDNKAGVDRGLSIHYGYNLTNISKNKDTSETFNAVYPFWDDGQGNITTVTNYIVQPTTPITPIKAVPLDCTDAFSAQPTNAQLVTYAQNYLDSNLPWLADEDITVDFVNDASNNGKMPAIGLGDTARVFWGDADVSAELRVVAYKYDVLGETFTEVRLGKKQSQFVAVTGVDAGGGASGTHSGGNLPSSMMFETKNISNGSSATINLASVTRGFIFSASYSTGGRDVIIYGVNSSGTVTYTQMRTPTGLTITTSTNSMTIANSSGSIVSVFIMHNTN